MIRTLVVAVVAVGVLAGAASAGGLPRASVDATFRAHELARAHRYEGARLTCTWTAGTFTYQCVAWQPSPVAEGTIVAGVQAHVFSRRTMQACAKTGAAGCAVATGKASCWYALGILSAKGAPGSVRLLNVCKAGWQHRLT